MANTALVNFDDVRPGEVVPFAGTNKCVLRYTAVVLTPAGALVRLPDGRPGLGDDSFVAVGPTDTTATLQTAITTAVRNAYGDGTIAVTFLD